MHNASHQKACGCANPLLQTAARTFTAHHHVPVCLGQATELAVTTTTTTSYCKGGGGGGGGGDGEGCGTLRGMSGKVSSLLLSSKSCVFLYMLYYTVLILYFQKEFHFLK